MMPRNETIQFTFKGRDQLSGPTATTQRRIDALGASLGKAGKIAAVAFGGAAIVGVGAFFALLKNGFQDAQTYNELARQTAGVIKSTGGEANVSAPHVRALASNLEYLSTVDENLIINSENVMLTFRHIRNEMGKGNDIFDQATKAALNLSIAMHEDLQTATVQVGKALDDPIHGMTNLRRIGVQFTDDQTKQIKALVKTGNLMQAQKIILHELSAEFGNAAKAAGEGLPGALFRLRDALTDGVRGMTMKYEPALAGFVNMIANQVPKAFADAAVVIDKVTAFISTQVAPRLVAAFKQYGPEIAAALAAARDKAVAVWQEYAPKLVTVLGQAKDEGIAAWKDFAPKLTHFVDEARTGAIDAWKDYAPKVAVLLGKARTDAINIWKDYGPKVAALLSQGKNDISNALGKIKGLDWGKILGDGKNLGLKIAGVLKDAGTEVYSATKTWGGRILDGITTGIKTGQWGPLGKTLGEGLATALLNAGSAVGKIAAAIGDWFSKIDWLSAGKKAADMAVPFIIGFVENFVDALLNFAFHHPMDMALFIATIIPIGKLATAFKPLRAAIEALPFGKAFLATIGKASSAVFDGLKSFFDGFFGAILTALEDEFPKLEKAVTFLFRGGIGGGIDGAKNTLIQKGEEAVIAIANGITFAVRKMADAIGLIVKTITWPFRNLYDLFSPKGKEIIKGLMDGALSLLKDIGTGMQEILHEISAPFVKADKFLLDKGRAIITGLWTGAQKEAAVLDQKFMAFITTIKGFFTKAGTWLVGKGSDILNGLWNGLFPWLKKIGNGLVNGIDTWLGKFEGAGKWLIGKGSDLLHGLWSGIQPWLKKVDDQFVGLRNSVVGFFKNGFNWLFNSGWYVAKGLWSGIKAGLGNAWNWVSSNIFTPIKNAIIGLFHIQSPSKVMMGLGGHVMGGFVKGLLLHNPTKVISNVAGSALKALGYMVKSGIVSITRVPAQLLGKLGNLGGTLGGFFGNLGSNPALGGNVKGFSPNVARWAGIVRAALMAEGLSPLLLGKVLTQMTTESGGNPMAENDWDINAINGDPSRGLMQVIGATFRAFHWPGTSNNIFDPVANIYAALNYARHRYGPNLNGLGQGHGYDSGGLAMHKGWFWKGTNRPERVLSPDQTRAFDRWMSHRPMTGHGAASRGDIHIHLNAPNFVGNASDLYRELHRGARSGQLRQIVAMATR